jgi:protein gp37
MKFSKISWTDHTHNHWIGCTKIRPGCDNCYACADFQDRKHLVTWGKGQPRKLTSKSNRLRPLRWNEEAKRLGIRYRVFCSSLSDIFDPEVPDEWRMDLFVLIRRTPNLDWMLLTKRVGGMLHWFNKFPDLDWPWPHVALGASIEANAATYDGRVLNDIAAARHFVSIEPLIDRVDCSRWIQGVDEVIVGGETGPKARGLSPQWIRDIRDECRAHRKTFVFKAWGDYKPSDMMRDQYLAAGWDPRERRGGRVLDNTLWLGGERGAPSWESRGFAGGSHANA